MSKPRTVFVALAAVLIGAGAALQWWSRSKPEPADVAAPAAQASAPLASVPAVPVVPIPIAPPPAPPLAADGVEQALSDLLGRKAVLTYLQTDDFPRRLVATVDNFGRAHAASRLWPLNPAPGRFAITERNGVTVIAADNARRYATLVGMLEGVDPARAARLYGRLYPLLQRSYQDLGYPKDHFNQRLIAVIDLLLATPAATEAMAVRLTEVKGPIASTRPWVRYEFADPALEALSSGQKVLLRVGPANQRRLKAVLAAVRRELMAAVAR